MPGAANLGKLKNMVSLFKGAKDPQALVMQMASQNPQMKTILDMVKGGNPEQIFYDVCKQRNVDPSDILSIMK